MDIVEFRTLIGVEMLDVMGLVVWLDGATVDD